ncbi:BamA/TamA family outer membrane protein [Serratia proteamaculans]|uniref:BamA/TamA family outer membrane protein n=1 Tax=Serratia proteamaculans TaxID=28151 RepID=UPI001C58D1EC|nr:BamA/TamA family outer membrane protein [Serratia proteamaculans]WEO87269.1 BamA/TamA family outer membrane protein [Serratia proteamaculans]
MKRPVLWLGGLCSLLTLSVNAELLTRESIDQFLGTMGADDQYHAAKGVNWTVLPGPFYTPELKLGLGTAVAGLYRVDPNDKLTQNSSISFTGFISTSGALGLGLNNYTFFSDDQWRLFVEGSVAKIPTEFWGVGYDAAQGSGQKYTQDSFSVHPQVFYRLVDNLYAGVGWDFSTLEAKVDDPQPGDSFSRYTESTSPLSSGATFALDYDSRDAITQPKNGQYASVQYSLFDPSLGSDTHFTALQLQYNYYFPLNENDVLAFDAWGRFARGEVPWDRLSQAGDDRRLRGYYQGRYRDKDVVSTQIEYRKKLNWRHGYVLWLGAGSLGASPDKMGQHPILPTLGAGYRFEIKPDMNLRLDLGVGRESAGFYFQVAEAF